MMMNKGNKKQGDDERIITTGLKLMLIVMVSVSLLGYINSITEERIASLEIMRFEEGLREVVPQAEGFVKIREDVFSAYDEIGKIYLVDSRGYGGAIEMLVGIDGQGRILKVCVIKHMETPGIGSKIVEDDDFLRQFEGMDVGDVDLGGVDAISGATVSSNAVVEGIKTAVKMWSDER